MSYAIDLINYLATNPVVLVALFLLYLLIFSVSIIWSPRKPGLNPFKCDARKTPKLHVSDCSIRDKVLKVGFQRKLVPNDLDAVVIGSGIGGLATAALLSKVGKKVLVLEQHDQAGGCCHTFNEKGFEFDIGIHYIGGMRGNSENKFLLDQISHGQIQWDDLDNDFDLVAIGGSDDEKMKFFSICGGGHDAYKLRLLEAFPKEKEAIEKYVSLLKKANQNVIFMVLFKIMPTWLVKCLVKTKVIHLVSSYFNLAGKTLDQVLNELTSNEELKSVLSYNFGDYGVEPSRSSFLFHAVLTNHYMKGAFYPRGGASELAFHIIPLIQKAGGAVLVRAKVEEIIIENGKATGVRLETAGTSIDIKAKVVISDAGACNTLTRLLPRQLAEKTELFSLLDKRIKIGLSALSLFVGLDGSSSDLGLKKQNVWMISGGNLSARMDSFLKKSSEEALDSEIPMIFISSPSARDSTYEDRHPGKSALTVVVPAQWNWFQDWKNERVKNRGEDYKARKGVFIQKIWRRVLEIYPHLEDKVQYMDLGTGLSNNFYLNSVEGEIYGLDHSKERFSDPDLLTCLRPEIGIPGLLLTGQDVLCCGFMGALRGAILTASVVLNRNLSLDLKQLFKQSKSNSKPEESKKDD